MAKQIICKSCQVPCVVDGDEITCEQCGTTFIKKAGEVKVKEIGRLDRIEKDIAEIKAALKPESEPQTSISFRKPEPISSDTTSGNEEPEEDEDEW